MCQYVQLKDQTFALDDEARKKIGDLAYALSSDGLRILGVAYKEIGTSGTVFSTTDESDLRFVGFVAFLDPPKESAKESIQALQASGIELKMITGDSELVTRKVCQELDFHITGTVLGKDLVGKTQEQLQAMVEGANIFARVNPAQKNDIILPLRRTAMSSDLSEMA